MSWWKACDKSICGSIPNENEAIWIETFQGHVNLAWYIDGRFWPYGGNIKDGRQPFGDKFGHCDVCFWMYAQLPDPANCFEVD